MISSEVQRTLVKSPPELWAELSDPAALARHLGELGEIRITRTEPEKTVEWEAENTTGTVSIQPSGWGTRVTLSVTREVVGATDAETADAEIAADVNSPTESLAPVEQSAAVEPNAEPEPLNEPAALATEPTSTAPEPEVVPEPEAPVEPESAAAEPELAEAEATPAEPAPEPRRGFFARLFGRKRKVEATEPRSSDEAPASTNTDESSDPFAAVREALTPESVAAIDLLAVVPATQPAPQGAPHPPEAEQQQDTKPEQIADIAAELRAAEEVAEEEVTAVLAAVLDRLGAAHHRPFSRS
ncbi:MAG: hypothetical protein ABR992_08525 [Solirubrobacteraceae bacterium]|jgi:hypothetical protein